MTMIKEFWEDMRNANAIERIMIVLTGIFMVFVFGGIVTFFVIVFLPVLPYIALICIVGFNAINIYCKKHFGESLF